MSMMGQMQDKKSARDMLSLVGSMKKKAYIPEWMVRQYCPNAEIVYKKEPNMYSFEILYDSIEKFFNDLPNIKKVYIDETNNISRTNDDEGYLPQIVDYNTYIIMCSI